MEYGLRVTPNETVVRTTFSLNPCFDGIWSARMSSYSGGTIVSRLNPCFDGIWSARVYTSDYQKKGTMVLILVLMEYGLRGSNL